MALAISDALALSTEEFLPRKLGLRDRREGKHSASK
jgi:hypothetical protein